MNTQSRDFLFLMDVIEDTVADGPGMRIAVYGAGCRHQCPGCHNPQSWNRENGHIVKIEKIVSRILADPFANVTFSGGDPLEQVEAYTELARRIKTLSRKNIWCYTGYTFEQVMASPRLSMILPYIDVMVDGRFMKELANPELLFRGSSNQRLVNVPESMAAGKVVELNYNPIPVEFVN